VPSKPGRNEFVEHVLELLAPLGNVSARRMFGGYGIYRDGLMLGLVASDVLYLKADTENRGEYHGMAPEIDGRILINDGVAPAGTFAEVEITEAHSDDIVGRIVGPLGVSGVIPAVSLEFDLPS
jgi:hypothetical protein